MLRRTLQRLVRLSPGVARRAWQALPERARAALSPLVHPIAAGRREGAQPLEVPRPERAACFDVVVAPEFALDPDERARLERDGHRVLELGSSAVGLDALLALAREHAALDAVLLTTDAALRDAATRLAWRVASSPEDLGASFPPVSVVIPTHAARELCQSCLHALARNTAWPSLRIVVVDDASSDGTEAMLAKLAAKDPRITVVRQPERRGFAAACNAGLARAEGDFVVLLNDDTVVGPGWLSRLVAHLERDLKLGLVGPVTNQIGNEAKIPTEYDSLDGMEQLARERAFAHAGGRFDLPTLALFCAAMRLPLLRDLGGLDERFEIGMFEDDDLSRTLRERGLALAVARDAFVHHVGQATLGKLGDDEYLALWEANKKRFEDKWGEAWRPPEPDGRGRGPARRPRDARDPNEEPARRSPRG